MMAESGREGGGTSTMYPFAGSESTTPSSPLRNLNENSNEDGNIGDEGGAGAGVGGVGDDVGVLLRSLYGGWMLECLLDVKEVPLWLLQTIVDQIPHIREARCSRLLLKLALRYLEEAVEYGDLDVCDIPLVRFVVQEGRSTPADLRRIHSLKQSFENDLILRVETEAVLRNLRRGSDDSGEGKSSLEAFEDAVETVFPEDFCEERGVQRRKELIALLPDRSEGLEAPNGDLERVLKKYPLDELLRDISNVVEDKNKSFRVKFLDKVAKDNIDGVYVPSPLDTDLRDNLTAACLHEECASDLEGGDAAVPGFVRSNEPAAQSPARDLCCEVDTATGVAHDLTDPVLNMQHATRSRESTLPEVVSMVSKQAHENFTEALAAEQAESMAGISEVPDEFGAEIDALASTLRNGFNEHVNDISGHSKNLRNIAGCIPVFNDNPVNQPKAGGVRPSSGRDAAWTMQEDCEAVSSSQGVGLNTAETHRPRKDSMDGGDQVGNQIPKEACRAEYSKEKHEAVSTAPISVSILERVSPPMKRGPNDCGDNSVPKKAKSGVSHGEHEGLNEQEHSNSRERSPAVQNVGLRYCPSACTKDGNTDGSRKEAHSGTAAVVNENDREGGTRRTRIYLSRLSKDGVASPVKVGATSPELRQEKGGRDGELIETCYRATSDELGAQVTGSGDRELNKKCYLCGKNGGIQSFCHRCLMLAHECCLLNSCTAKSAGFDSRRFCFNCASKTAHEDIKTGEDSVKLAEKVLTMAEEAFKKAEEAVKVARKAAEKAKTESLNTKERLSSYLKGAVDWSFEHCQAHESSFEHERQERADISKGRTSQVAPVGKEAPVNFSFESERRDRQVSEGDAPITVTENRMSGNASENVAEPDSMRQPSPQRERSSSLPRSVAPVENLASGRVTESRIPSKALEDVVNSYPKRQPSPQRDTITLRPRSVTPVENLASEGVTESRLPGRTSENAVEPDSMNQPSPQRESNTILPHSSAPTENLAYGRDDSAKGFPSSQPLAEKPGSSAVDAAPVNGTSPVGDEEKTGSDERRNSAGQDGMTDRMPFVPRSHRQDEDIAGVRPTNRRSTRATASTLPLGESSAAQVQHDATVNIAGDEGDGHDGDLEEVHETSRTAADGDERAEEAGDHLLVSQISKVSSKIEAKPSRGLGRVYRGRTQIPGVRRKTLPWTDIEEAALAEGVKLYSNGGEWGFQWKRVLDFGFGKFHESRTTVDLKDKWRNLKKAEAKVSGI